eukprot:m.1556405 g.1556405  ORF g.1556405 m.1556405 type:complete len:68 (-) comp25272_c2_seq18:2194-2397(-)
MKSRRITTYLELVKRFTAHASDMEDLHCVCCGWILDTKVEVFPRQTHSSGYAVTRVRSEYILGGATM